MILASSNCAGWSLFQRELRNFFTGAKPVSTAEGSAKNGGGGGSLSTSGDQSGKRLSTYGPQQNSGILKILEQIWGRTGFLESLQ